MKISQKKLENIIKEEVGGALEEGPFSKMFNKAMQGLKTRNVAKQDKEMGIQRTTTGPEKEKPADKFMDNKTKKSVTRIAAEILSDIANIDISKTKHLKKIDPESYGTARARRKTDIIREEETLEEATPKEVKFHSNLINTAIKDGEVTLEGLLDDIISLSKTNPIVKAMVGVDELVAQFDKAEEPAPQTSAEPEVPSEKGRMSAAELGDYVAANRPQDPRRPATSPETSGQSASDGQPQGANTRRMSDAGLKTTPSSTQLFKPNELQLAQMQYAPIFKDLGMKKVIPILSYLVSNSLLYKTEQLKEVDVSKMQKGFGDIALTKKGQPRKRNPIVPTGAEINRNVQKEKEKEKEREKKGSEVQKQETPVQAPKIWQDAGAKNVPSLKSNQDFKDMVSAIRKEKNINDANLVYRVLYRIWQLGKLGKPIPKQSDFEAQDDEGVTYGVQSPFSLQEQKDRWQKLARILKD